MTSWSNITIKLTDHKNIKYSKKMLYTFLKAFSSLTLNNNKKFYFIIINYYIFILN